MKDQNQPDSNSPAPRLTTTATNADPSHRDDLRFWQTVSLSLALFAFGLIASLMISLIVMLVAK